MRAVVMAGGRGSRMGSRVEKPLVRFGGKPMVVRVVEAVREAGFYPVGATSPHTPETERVLEAMGVEVFRTPGEGFVRDVGLVVEAMGRVLVVCADMPLLRGQELRWVAGRRERGSVNVVVPRGLVRALGLAPPSVEGEFVHAGVCVASDSGECRRVVSFNPRLAVNVNSRGDLSVAYAVWRVLNAGE